MDSLGTEVGQKMRSAVKAKLIELGTGGAAGYIDDELPDYVMIMVANKRSKQQMIGDLNLFLGSQTELFVTWLHEVLQKLQEVTLPANVVQKAKRKANEIENTTTSSTAKKEKKEKRKERRIKRSNSDKTTEDASSSANISDVVADHLLQKAKKTMEEESAIQVKGGKKENKDITDQFDIPTITEISAERGENRIPNQKELAELEELQKKIDQAKRQLKAIASDESEDEDFLNIKEDAEEFDDDINDKANKRNKAKSPIVFTSNQINESNDGPTSSQQTEKKSNKRVPITFNRTDDDDRTLESSRPKRPIHERLGLKSPRSKENVISLSTHRRSEKELYVPVFRRNEAERERDRERQRDRERERDRDLRDRGRSREQESERENSRGPPRVKDKDDSKQVVRQRIGSRVIVAPPKPEYEENESDDIDRPVNSVIKIKPRPPVSPSKQASKNLLLRAVAEAQKSTALVKPPKKDNSRSLSPNVNSRSQKLYSKSYRDRNRKALLKRAAKDNIVIEVNATTGTKRPSSRAQRDEDEYIPEPISDRGDSDTDFVYVPRAINSVNSDEEYEGIEREQAIQRSKTQFVVTLDDQSREKFVSKHKIRVVDKNINGLEIKRLDLNDDSTHSHHSTRSTVRRDAGRSKSSKSAKSNENYHHNYEKPKEVKKIIIKNDTEDEDSASPTKENRRKHSLSAERSTTPPLPKSAEKPNLKRKRSTVSPIKFDLNEESSKRRSKSGDRENGDRDIQDKEKERDRERHDENQQKISIKKTEKKYDNIPELLSSVPVEASTLLIKPKTKERCKYFPTCGKGDSCEFHHPTVPCKAFPNCKFADKCMFLHPKCKFDLTCNRVSCNFQHSVPITQSAAPPLSSHVVPVQNYKSIIATPLPAICKYYPNCTNSVCNFYHPKLCRFGKNCMNKVECNFYHHDIPPIKDKFKWVASLG